MSSRSRSLERESAASRAHDEVPAALPDRAPREDLSQGLLLGMLGETLEAIDRALEPATPSDSANVHQARRLAILRGLLARRPAELVPELCWNAPLGHAFPQIDAWSEGEPGSSLALLEELADCGLLERSLHNRVHACAKCGRCQLNLRETCASCGALDLRVERLVHHFRCAYVGLESEFTRGLDLFCPRCRHELHQLGDDFERPHETYACPQCTQLSDEPRLEAQCLACGHVALASELAQVPIHRYRPTAFAAQAVRTGRLEGFDLGELLVDRRAGLDSAEFLALELAREVARLAATGAPFTTARVEFRADGGPYPLLRESSAADLRGLAEHLTRHRSALDVVASTRPSCVAFLFPTARAQDLPELRRRLEESLASIVLTTCYGQTLRTSWAWRTWSDPSESAENVAAFLGVAV